MSLSLSIYIYMYTHVYTHVYIYIYIYIYTNLIPAPGSWALQFEAACCINPSLSTQANCIECRLQITPSRWKCQHARLSPCLNIQILMFR